MEGLLSMGLTPSSLAVVVVFYCVLTPLALLKQSKYPARGSETDREKPLTNQTASSGGL